MIINILHLKFDRRGVLAITTEQLHSTKLELRFCSGTNPNRGVSIYGGGISGKKIHHYQYHDQELLNQPWSWHFKNYIRSMCRFNPVYQTQSVSKVMSSDADYFRLWDLLLI